MTHQATFERLSELRLHGITELLRRWEDKPPPKDLTFEERLAMLVEHEASLRSNRRIARLLKDAALPQRASLEDVVIDPARGLDRAVLRSLATAAWVREHHNVILVGATGVGKSFLASALAETACRHGLSAMYVRAPRLLQQRGLPANARSQTHPPVAAALWRGEPGAVWSGLKKAPATRAAVAAARGTARAASPLDEPGHLRGSGAGWQSTQVS